MLQFARCSRVLLPLLLLQLIWAEEAAGLLLGRARSSPAGQGQGKPVASILTQGGASRKEGAGTQDATSMKSCMAMADACKARKAGLCGAYGSPWEASPCSSAINQRVQKCLAARNAQRDYDRNQRQDVYDRYGINATASFVNHAGASSQASSNKCDPSAQRDKYQAQCQHCRDTADYSIAKWICQCSGEYTNLEILHEGAVAQNCGENPCR